MNIRTVPPDTSRFPLTGVWTLEKRQIRAILVGLFLGPLVKHVLLFLPLSNTFYFEPMIIFVLFFGAMFGPWVGVVVGGAGTLIDTTLSFYGKYDLWVLGGSCQSLQYADLGWQQALQFALTGFIAGLSIYWTDGHFRTYKDLLVAQGIGSIALLIGTGVYNKLTLLSPFPLEEIPREAVTLLLSQFVLLLLFSADYAWERKKHISWSNNKQREKQLMRFSLFQSNITPRHNLLIGLFLLLLGIICVVIPFFLPFETQVGLVVIYVGGVVVMMGITVMLKALLKKGVRKEGGSSQERDGRNS